jgi:hypothetical protein
MPQAPKRRSPEPAANPPPPRQDGAPASREDRRERKRRVAELRARLGQEEAALARWMTRLKRAFRAVEKHQQRVARTRRQLAKVEG